jgi:hypothetical protein
MNRQAALSAKVFELRYALRFGSSASVQTVSSFELLTLVSGEAAAAHEDVSTTRVTGKAPKRYRTAAQASKPRLPP